MNAKHFRWLFLLIAIGLLIREYSSQIPTIGATLVSSDGQYRFSGGTEPTAIAFALGVIALFVLFLFSKPARLGGPIPGILPRFAAVLLDFFLYMMAVAPLLGIAPVLMEWRRTGVFAWSFERDTAAPYDGWIDGSLLVLGFAGMALFFALPLMVRKPSPGSCIMGYQIVKDDGTPMTFKEAVLRTVHGFRAVSYRTLFNKHDKSEGKLWLDEKFGTHAATFE